jgi:hypothetical protein
MSNEDTVQSGSAKEGETVWAINEWCVAARISPAFFFKRHRMGCGSRTASVGRRTIILESPHAYFTRIAREAEFAQPRVQEAV